MPGGCCQIHNRAARTLCRWIRNVDKRLPGKGNSISHGARPVHQIMSMMKWLRTSKLSITKSLSVQVDQPGVRVESGAAGDPGYLTLHPAPYTLHSAPHTLHPAPCTLYPAPCTKKNHAKSVTLVPADIQEKLLRSYVKWFRARLVFKADRLVYHSTVCWRVLKRRREENTSRHQGLPVPT